MSVATPTVDELEDLLLACRYGDLEDVQQFVDRFGPDPLNDARDERGNTVLHMVAGNGHIETLEYLLRHVPPALLSARNDARSTALHWAALNSHLAVAQALVKLPGGPGADLIDAKNEAGRTPLGEAENVGWEDGAKWFVEVMKLEENQKGEELQVAEDAEDAEKIEVEIQDAEGQIAKMTIGQRPAGESSIPPSAP
ncbi:ankyrin [Daedalea quercina L-15889]|uniref:Ankyrin n=1 Tax=Daedalea quercina L-15889 TaxID=1314783 RepID=A0A165QM83_9APHY|nr:ankyrin [Daedalea quercina L-15889]